MNYKQKQAMAHIKTLFDSQTFAVLSTQRDGQPYASLVAFGASNSLHQIFFLTPRSTRKYKNLIHNPNVAVLISNHENKPDDTHKAVCVTATGTAFDIENQQKNEFSDLITERHPHLKAFSMDAATALVCVRVETFFVVSEFQDVIKIKIPS